MQLIMVTCSHSDSAVHASGMEAGRRRERSVSVHESPSGPDRGNTDLPPEQMEWAASLSGDGGGKYFPVSFCRVQQGCRERSLLATIRLGNGRAKTR